MRHETLTAKRMALIGLRNDGTISDELLHHLEHELDVEALRLGLGERRTKTRSLEPTSVRSHMRHCPLAVLPLALHNLPNYRRISAVKN